MSPLFPEAAAFRAGRLMLEKIEFYAKRMTSFGFETTLSGRSYMKLIRTLKKTGYEVHFFFLWVPTVALALSRVRARAAEGAHSVPEIVIRRRFDRSIHNFLMHYRLLPENWPRSRSVCKQSPLKSPSHADFFHLDRAFAGEQTNPKIDQFLKTNST